MKTSAAKAHRQNGSVWIQSNRGTKRQSKTLSWLDLHVDEEQTVIVMRGLWATRRGQENRSARIEELKALVQAGTYHVDSTILAESILANETSLIEAR